MEKKAISNGWFYRLYAVCGGCFLLLCGAAVLSLSLIHIFRKKRKRKIRNRQRESCG